MDPTVSKMVLGAYLKHLNSIPRFKMMGQKTSN